MAELKKTLFFGYSRNSVEKVLKEQQQSYENRMKELEISNAETTKLVQTYKEREAAVSDALIEAKRFAQEMITKAQYQSEKMIRATEARLTERVKQTEVKLQELEATKRVIMDHEEFMKVELRQLLNRQMDMINQFDNKEIKQRENEIERLMQESYDSINKTRRVALGEEVKLREGIIVEMPEDKNHSFLKHDTGADAPDSDLPLFKFEGF